MDRGAAIDRLPEAYANALRLYDQGHDNEAIAAQLNLPPEAVGPLLRLAAPKLQTIVAASEALEIEMDLSKLPITGTLKTSEYVLRGSPEAQPSAGASPSADPCKPPVTALGDYKGKLLQHARVALIFWGSEWTQSPPPSPTSEDIASAVYRIVSGFYMTKLTQYRQIAQATLIATDLNTSDPPVSFTDQNVEDMIQARVAAGKVPSPASGTDLLYAVILPQSVGGTSPASSDHAAIGYHGFFTVSGNKAYWLWANNPGSLTKSQSATSIFSHELIEACSDAEGLGIRVQNDLGTGPEIGDPCLNCWEMADGFTVQAYWSAADQRCVTPLASNLGKCQRFSCSTSPSGLHICAIDAANVLHHTLGNADDTLYQTFGDVQEQTRLVGPNLGETPFVACAASPNGDLHVLALDGVNKLWHTIRQANGTWQKFGDVQEQTRLVGPNPGIGETPLVGCSFDKASILHVCATDSKGALWRTIRSPNRSWPLPFAIVPA